MVYSVRLQKIVWLKDGYGYQVLHLGRSQGVCLGHVKIWKRHPLTGETEVVDRALSVKVARKRISLLRRESLPFGTESDKPVDPQGQTKLR